MENTLLSLLDALFHFTLHTPDVEDKPIAHYTRHCHREGGRDFNESNLQKLLENLSEVVDRRATDLASAPEQEVG
jgi:hypothetical protein